MLPLRLADSCIFAYQDVAASETFRDSPNQNWAPLHFFLTVSCYFCSLNRTPSVSVSLVVHSLQAPTHHPPEQGGTWPLYLPTQVHLWSRAVHKDNHPLNL